MTDTKTQQTGEPEQSDNSLHAGDRALTTEEVDALIGDDDDD